ncbi:MAG: YraN family protein [Lachnospiraceae bacterium]|nr:YraN family protein [Lachnospiraceae bacterium]
MNKRTTGARYEGIAARFLELQGFEILARNYRCREGEIDLVTYDPTAANICFTEVKYRSSLRCGYPSEAVNAAKRTKIRNVSRHYLMDQTRGGAASGPVCGYRYDVVEIVGDKIRVLKNAF